MISDLTIVRSLHKLDASPVVGGKPCQWLVRRCSPCTELHTSYPTALTIYFKNVKKCLYELVIVITALYGAMAWGMRSAERKKVNVLEMKCLRSLVGVSGMDRIRNEEVHI